MEYIELPPPTDSVRYFTYFFAESPEHPSKCPRFFVLPGPMGRQKPTLRQAARLTIVSLEAGEAGGTALGANSSFLLALCIFNFSF